MVYIIKLKKSLFLFLIRFILNWTIMLILLCNISDASKYVHKYNGNIEGFYNQLIADNNVTCIFLDASLMEQTNDTFELGKYMYEHCLMDEEIESYIKGYNPNYEIHNFKSNIFNKENFPWTRVDEALKLVMFDKPVFILVKDLTKLNSIPGNPFIQGHRWKKEFIFQFLSELAKHHVKNNEKWNIYYS